MPVQLVVKNTSDVNIDLSKGIDLGLSRKGKDNISSFLIVNQGNITANNVTLTGVPYNTLQDVKNGYISPEEYNKQEIAAVWKTFAKSIEGPYVSELNLGNIGPGLYFQGVKTTEVSFYNQGSCRLESLYNQNGTIVISNNVYSWTKEANGYARQRITYEDLEIRNTSHYELTFNVRFLSDSDTDDDPYMFFPVRNNVLGNSKGYGFELSYNRGTGQMTVKVKTDAVGVLGIYEDLNLGTTLCSTRAFDNSETMELTFKCYDDDKGIPCFEVLWGQNNQTLYAQVGDDSGAVFKDTSRAYKGAGPFYIDFALNDGDTGIELRNMVLKTDEKKQPIYIKTTVGDNALDKTQYKTAMQITYTED